MGIAYFPDIYEDELVYSVLARFYVKSGYARYMSCAGDIFLDKRMAPDIEFLNPMKPEAVKLLCKGAGMEEVAVRHTMLPFYIRFMDKERRCRALEAAKLMKGDYNNLCAVPKMKNGKQKYLRYCVLCAAEDRLAYGETYWHRSHQMQGTGVCYKHGCRLCESRVLISGKEPPRLTAAEQEINDAGAVVYGSRLEWETAAYAAEVFQIPLDMESGVRLGSFLHNRLAGTKYLSIRGGQRKMGMLCSDFAAFYKGLEASGCGVPDRSRIEKIFTGYRCSTYETCLLAGFLNIPAKELARMQTAGQGQTESFDKKVMEMLEAGTGVNETARRLGVSSLTVRNIKNQRHTGQRKAKVYSVPCGRKAQDWKKTDEETLPMVRAAVKLLEGNGVERPKKVTFHAVSRLLGLPDKRLGCLPLCSAEIKKHSVSQEMYWAKEMQWAVMQAENSGCPLNWKNVRTLTNMRKENAAACLPELEKLDAGLAQLVKRIL